MNEMVTLQPGMILYDPNAGSPKLWTVKAVGSRQATLVAHYDTCYVDAKLKGKVLPEGWRVLDNKELGGLVQTCLVNP